MKYQREFDFLSKLVYDVQNECMGGNFGVYAKSRFDLVTDVDYRAEEFIRKRIGEEFPGDGILGEEFSPEKGLSARTWVVDPIDGTCNFALGSPLFGIQVCLTVDGEPVVSVLCFPALSETYLAHVGEGAYLNGRKLDSVQNFPLEKCMIGFGDYSHRFPQFAAAQHRAIGRLFPKAEKIRMFGTSAFDFACVASGKTMAAVLLTDNIWDLAPGLLLAKETGCFAGGLDGKPFRFGQIGLIAACSEELYREIVGALGA